jgi:DNA-binding response OmpR family regulator
MTATAPFKNTILQKTVESRKTVILAISPDVEDHEIVRQILEGSGWRTLACKTRGQARRLWRQASVVLCEQKLPDGDWKEVLTELQSVLDPPLLIVMSRLADSGLWAEVLNLGGYDVLAKPLKAEEVLWTVATAHRCFQSPSIHKERETICSVIREVNNARIERLAPADRLLELHDGRRHLAAYATASTTGIFGRPRTNIPAIVREPPYPVVGV